MKCLVTKYRYLGCIAACVMSLTAYAEKADRDKPAIIDADKLTHSEKTQTQVAQGNVVFVKGTLQVKAAWLEASQDEQGNQIIKVRGEANRPATFKQKREGLDEYLDAQAMAMEFDAKTDTVTLTDNAVLRRIAGTKPMDEVRGATIKYYNQTEVYEVKGGTTSSFEGGRVRVVLAPRLAPTTTAAPKQPLPAANTQGKP